MGLMSLRSALCVWLLNVSTHSNFQAMQTCHCSQIPKSLKHFENASLLFIYCACSSFLLIDVLTICHARIHQVRLAPFRAVQ